MSTLKVNNIQNASGTDAISIGSDGSLSYPNIGRRNLIINGAMQVAQRGTSVSGGSMGRFQWVADRFWVYGPSTTSGSVSQSTDVPSNQGFIYSLYNNTDAACSTGTNVELPATGSAGLFYSGQTFTLSFWVKGTSAVAGQTIFLPLPDNATLIISSSGSSLTMLRSAV